MFKKILCVLLSSIMLFGASFALTGCGGPKDFTVTFNANGGFFVEGDEQYEKQTVTDAKDLVIPIVKRISYNFVGWDKVVKNIKGDTTVNAVWEKRAEFTVTFVGNGGVYVGGGLEVQNVTDATQIVLPVYVKEGYALVWDKEYIRSLTTSATITATWKPVESTVSFVSDLENENWGEFDVNSTLIMTYERSVLGLPTPTHNNPNKKLCGWEIVDNEGKQEYNGIRVYENSMWRYLKNVALKPVWTEDYVINYDLAGGYFENNEGITSFKSTNETFALNNPVRIGYVFLGWTGEGFVEPQISIVIEKGTAKDLSYTANWLAKEYTVTFDLDGGECDTTKATFVYGNKIVSLPIPVKEGYAFMCWTYGTYEFKGGDNGDKVWDIPQAVTLKAKYIRQFTIKFVLDYSYKDNTGKTHKLYFTYNGDRTIANTTILSGETFVSVLEKYESGLKAYPKNANTDNDYKFKYWMLKIDGKEHPISDKTRAFESYAVDGVITVYAVGKSIWYGPY